MLCFGKKQASPYAGASRACWYGGRCVVLEYYAVGEHDVAHFADQSFGEAAGIVLVDEVVERHGEHEQAFVVSDFVGVGEGEVQSPSALKHVFVGGA